MQLWLRILVLALPWCSGARAGPTFRGEAAHSGVYDSPAPALRVVKWKFKTGGRVFSSPAVAGGAVYFGSTDHMLYAVNAAGGTLRWKFRTQGRVSSSPAVAGGVVYFTSTDGKLYAVAAEDGKLRWDFTTAGERRFTAPGIHGLTPRTETMPDPFDLFLSSPVVVSGVVYFGSGDFHVYAVDAVTGTLKWKFATGNVVHASPALAGGMIYIGSWDRYLYALDTATGALKWKFATGDDTATYNQVGIASSAAVAAGLVYFGCRDGNFYAVDAGTGELRWKHDNHKGWVIASPAVADGIVYFPTSDGTRFKALDAATGATRFDTGMKAISFSSPAVASGTAVFGTSDGVVHAIDAKTGRIRAQFQTDGHRQNAALYLDAEGKMNSASLYPDFTLDGAIIGLDRMFSLGSVLSSPVVADGVTYFGSGDGHLYAVE